MLIASIIVGLLVLAGLALAIPHAFPWSAVVLLAIFEVFLGLQLFGHHTFPRPAWIIFVVLLAIGLAVALRATRRGFAWLMALGTAVVVLWASVFVGTPTSEAASDQTKATNVAFDPGVDLIPAEAKCTTDTYNTVSAMPAKAGDPNARQFPTAVSSPFKATTAAGVTTETMAENCTNPTWFEQAIQFMETPEWHGIPGATSNDGWLKTIRSDIASHGLEGFVVKDKTSGALTTTDTYRKYASWVNVVILRFSEGSEKSLPSLKNWEISVAQDPTKIPVTQLAADQESKPAWTYTAVDKNSKCILTWGLNALDKRIELFSCTTTPPTPGKPGKPSTPPTTPPPPDVCLNIPGTQTAVPPGKYQEGGNCYEQKSHSNDTNPPAGTNQQGPGPATSANQGTGAGTSGNAVNNTPGTDKGSSVPVQGASPAPTTFTPPPAGTGTTSSGGSSTVNGSNPNGSNPTPIATPFG